MPEKGLWRSYKYTRDKVIGKLWGVEVESHTNNLNLDSLFSFACPEQSIFKIYFNIYLNKEF